MIIEICDYEKEIQKTPVLRKVNLTMESGVCYGFQGKNGCGKTMLMRAIAGLIFPTMGCVKVDGKVIGKDISFPESMGILIENPAFLPGFTGMKNLQLLADIRGKVGEEEIRKTLQEVGLDPDDKRKYRKYSLGMKQRLGIAAAFMEEPELIILDEPINAIDANGVEQVKQMIRKAKERGALLIVACHDKEELYSLADEIVVIEEGRVTNVHRIGEERENADVETELSGNSV